MYFGDAIYAALRPFLAAVYTLKYMATPKMIPRLLVLSAVVLAAACESDGPMPPTPPPFILTTLKQVTLGDVNTFGSATALMGAPVMAVPPSFDVFSCPYAPSDQSFTCTPRVESGLTFKLKYFVFDAGGHPQTAADPATTASVRAVLDVTGTVSASSGASSATVVVDHHSDNTLSGLQGATRTLNGTAHDHDVVTASGTSVAGATVDLTSTTTNLVLSSSSQWPASGTIATVANTTATAGGVISVSATVNAALTFNGTNFATLVLTAAGHTTTCRVDLTGAGSPSCT